MKLYKFYFISTVLHTYFIRLYSSCNSNIPLPVFSSLIRECNKIMDPPVRHECPCRGAKFMIRSHYRSSTGYVARVYPSRMLVSLMGCKRAEDVYMANGRMGQRAVYRKRNRARKCAGLSEEKALVHQSNKSLILVPGLPRNFFFSTDFLCRVSLSAQCKLQRELWFHENST